MSTGCEDHEKKRRYQEEMSLLSLSVRTLTCYSIAAPHSSRGALVGLGAAATTQAVFATLSSGNTHKVEAMPPGHSKETGGRERERNSPSSVPAAVVETEAEAEAGPGAANMKFVPASFNFKTYMSEKVRAVNAALDRAVPVKHPEVLSQAVRYSLLSGGKRVCTGVCIAACELVGGTQETAMPVACALEMIKDASMIHDDLPCMDNGDLRRGLPTNHKKFGEAIAVLSGDALLAYAFEHIARDTRGVPAERVLRAIAVIGKAVGSEGMVAGQVMDLLSEGDPNVDLERLEYIHLHKTAGLVVAAAVCGAVLGGGSEREIERVGQYARCVGHLFQVIDDILDATKSTEQLGKTAGKDVVDGKATYPELLGLDKAREVAQVLNRKAKEHLCDFDQQQAAPLLSLADFVLRREK